MADELTNIENAVLEEEGRLRDLDVALDLEEVAGNQQKAADAQARAEAAKQQGIQSTVSAAQSAMALAPLFPQRTANQKSAAGGVTGLDVGAFNKAGDGSLGNLKSFSDLNSLSNKQFRQFKRGLTPGQESMLFQSDSYINQYNDPFNILNQD